ncbi:C39 family peptidase (plasmid) [Haloferax sp. S1W]|uniref:C39 family peptidase n=1 Tax=Haloferax sp. S1W TaxID=3377110 RepID=UPI0037C823FC
MARQQGERPTGTYLYRGATTYSVELESGKQLYLNTGLKEGTTTETPQLEVEKHGESVESQWSTADTIPTGDVQIQGSYGMVNGIEPWDANGGSGSLSGSDEGGADTSVPDLYGNTPDKWAEWDGCAPFAGAQILMYHEGISVSDIEQREEMADRLHVLMETDPDGWTGYRMPRKGITRYPTSEVEHDYTGHDELWLSKKMFRNEIDAERPFMLNIPSNKGVKGDEKSYTGHTVVVHGYYESDNGFDVIHYNSWNTNEHRMQFGNWPINTWGRGSSTNNTPPNHIL